VCRPIWILFLLSRHFIHSPWRTVVPCFYLRRCSLICFRLSRTYTRFITNRWGDASGWRRWVAVTLAIMEAHRPLRSLDRLTSWTCGTFLSTANLRYVKDKTRSPFSSTSSRAPPNWKGLGSNCCARNQSFIKAKAFCHGYPGSTPKRFPSYASHTFTHLLHLSSGYSEHPISRSWLSGPTPPRWWATLKCAL